jgi:phosphatidylinositol alpha-1,6-mannosyltransferase
VVPRFLRLNVILLTDSFAPHFGGSALLYYEWSQRLADLPLNVITRDYPGAAEFDRSQNYRVTRVPFIDIPKLRIPLVWLFIFFRAFASLLKGSKDTVIIAGQVLETGLTAYVLSRIFGVPYIVQTFSEELNGYGRWTLTRQLMRMVLNHAGGVISISRYCIQRLRELELYDGQPIRVAPAVDCSRFKGLGGAKTRARLGLVSDIPLLLTVGRLTRRKGHDKVIAALPRIRERVPNVRYVIGGVGPEEPRLRALVQAMQLQDEVVFVGKIPVEELEGYFSAADVFVHPNREVDGDIEGFGLVFLEASACGTPVIGGRSGGALDAIQDGVTGHLVDGADVQEIADRCCELLLDPQHRAKMGSAGKIWASRFNWDDAVAQVRSLLLQVAPSEKV